MAGIASSNLGGQNPGRTSSQTGCSTGRHLALMNFTVTTQPSTLAKAARLLAGKLVKHLEVKRRFVIGLMQLNLRRPTCQ